MVTSLLARIAILYDIARRVNGRVLGTGNGTSISTHEKELGASWEEQDALAFLLFEKKQGIEEIVWKSSMTGTIQRHW
jgi:hypothetical protein